MSRAPTISILVPWANRSELAHCLRENARWFESHDAEVLLINAGGDEWLMRASATQSGNVPLRIINTPLKEFNRGLALNLGVWFSRAKLIFTLDCDVIMTSDLFSEAIEKVEEGAFATLKSRFESESNGMPRLAGVVIGHDTCIRSVRRRSYIEVQFSDGSCTSLQTSATDLLTGGDAGHGQVLMRKVDFLAVGGYYSGLETWGWEDDDILFRLQRNLKLLHVEAGEGVHLTHGDDKRNLSGGSRASRDMDNMTRCFERYAEGTFAGSYSDDVARWSALCEEQRGTIL